MSGSGRGTQVTEGRGASHLTIPNVELGLGESCTMPDVLICLFTPDEANRVKSNLGKASYGSAFLILVHIRVFSGSRSHRESLEWTRPSRCERLLQKH